MGDLNCKKGYYEEFVNDIPDNIKGLHNIIKMKKPVVQCITNSVTVNDCANILLAIGASPTMAHHIREVEEIQNNVDSLVCNMGAIDDFESMLPAAGRAAELDHPIVIDPVGVAASTYRRQRCIELIESVPTGAVSAIRGNHSEILALVTNANTATGVDDPSNANMQSDSIELMKELAGKWNTVLIASGRTDYITDGRDVIVNRRGDTMMSAITGAGCMSTAMLGAFMAAEKSIAAAAASTILMGIAGEWAAKETAAAGAGTMTFRMKLIDYLSLV